MSDPDETWELEADLTDFTSAEDIGDIRSVYRITDGWLRQRFYTGVVERAATLEGPWDVVYEASESSISVRNGIAFDGVAWSEDGFATYAVAAFPSGYSLDSFYNPPREKVFWDGENWGVFAYGGTPPRVGIAYTPDLADTAFAVNASSEVDESTSGEVLPLLYGSAGKGWMFVSEKTTVTFDPYTEQHRRYVHFADSFSGTWTSSLIQTSSDRLVPALFGWNGVQAVRVDTLPIDNRLPVWTSDSPGGTYTLANSPAPEGFSSSATDGTAQLMIPLRWNERGGYWVLLGFIGSVPAIAIAYDLSEPWDIVDIDQRGSLFRELMFLSEDRGEWMVGLAGQFAGGGSIISRSGIFMPSGSGAGWGLTL